MTLLVGRDGQEVLRLGGHSTRVSCVAIWCPPDAASLGGSRALSGHVDGGVRLWDLDSMKEIRRLHGPSAGLRRQNNLAPERREHEWQFRARIAIVV